MNRAIFAPLAERDLDEILVYIAERNAAAALQLVRKLRRKCDDLAEFPHMGRARPEFRGGDLRSFPVGNYLIFYRPVETGIEVARVLHGARDLESILNVSDKP